MPPPPRKIANKIVGGPQRYRPGKPIAVEQASSDEEEDEEPTPAPKPTPRPAVSSFPKAAFKPAAPQINEDDFETEESDDDEDHGGGVEASAGDVSSDGDSGSGSGGGESGSEEEEDSSSDDGAAKRRMLLRPMFVKKGQRSGSGPNQGTTPAQSEEQTLAEEEARRKAKADELIQAQIEKAAEERAAGKKFWDDEDVELIDDIDDTDNMDPEAEHAAWKLRELKRVKRDREALIAVEKEREEVERRRNLGEDERKAEDDEFLAKQREERDAKGKMDYMQKYYHKGAFFQEDAKAMGLDKRDIMGGTYENQVDRSVLPEYLQVRDMTRVGRKGRTKYKDMRSEDTGRWGDLNDRKTGGYRGQDERFMSDRDRERNAERTGANASALGERKRLADDDGRESKRPRAD